AGLLNSLEYLVVTFRRGDHFPLMVVTAQIIGSGIEHEIHQHVLFSLVLLDEDLALPFEHPGYAANFTHVPAELAEQMADLSDSPVTVVRGHLNNHSGAARTVAFKLDFFDLAAFQLTGTAHDGTLDIVGRHADCFRGGDGSPETSVGIRIAAAAGRDH